MSLILASLWIVLGAVAPPEGFGHGGAAPYILVPNDHVTPGEPFDVIAGDMSANNRVSFRLERDQLAVQLSSAVAGQDGHFTTQLAVPQDFPGGYSLLVAEADDGTSTSTWILVGARTGATPAPPGQLAWWADPSVILLGAAVVGGAGLLGFSLLRRRQRKPARVLTGDARRRSVGKAQRRPTRSGHR
jgi:hypothetical protein